MREDSSALSRPVGGDHRPLRVLFTLGSLGAGGAERRLVDLLKHLDRTRIAPALYLMERHGELLTEVPGDVSISQWTQPGKRPGLFWRALGYLAPSTARSRHLESHLRRQPADLIVGWMLQSAYEASGPAGRLRIPLMACSAVSPDADVATAFGSNDPQGVEKAQETFRRAALVVTNSEDGRGELSRRYQLSPEKTVFVPNLRDFGRIDRLSREDVSWPVSGRIRILSVGRLQPQKGFLDLIEAFRQVRERRNDDVSLTILGEGPQRGELERAVGAAGLVDRVAFPGHCSNPYPYLHMADLFVLASHFEGMPNVLLEALSLGTPVVATDCPTGPREALEGGRWGRLVPMSNPTALADAIVAALDNPLDARRQAEAGARFIRAKHDVAAHVRSFEDILVRAAQMHCH